MSELEKTFAFQIKCAGLPEPMCEFRFCERKWRFDFAWPPCRIAAEVEGGTWVYGRHSRGSGFENDCRKYNRAALEGWRVLRFTTSLIESGEALTTLETALRTCGGVHG